MISSHIYYISLLLQNNTYQAIIITDTTIKTYAIYTYQCGALNWAGEGIIGFNAGGDYYDNYPLSGLPQSNAIACVHANVGSVWNNQVYNLVPNPGAFTGLTTPEPPSSLGMGGYCTHIKIRNLKKVIVLSLRQEEKWCACGI